MSDGLAVDRVRGIPLDSVPRDVVDYLMRAVTARRPRRGVTFVRSSPGFLGAKPAKALVAATVAVLIAAWLFSQKDIRFDTTIARATAAVIVCVAFGGVAYFLRVAHAPAYRLGSFDYLGPTAWWSVERDRLVERPWSLARSANAYRRAPDGTAYPFAVRVEFAFGASEFHARNVPEVEAFLRYVSGLAHMPRAPDGRVEGADEAPTFTKIEKSSPFTRLTSPLALGLAVASVTLLASWAVVPAVSADFQERALRQTALTEGRTKHHIAVDYLRRFPGSSAAPEVRAMLDKALFDSVVAAFARDHSLAPIQGFVLARPHAANTETAREFMRAELRRLVNNFSKAPRPREPQRRLDALVRALLGQAAERGDVRIAITVEEQSQRRPRSQRMRQREEEIDGAYIGEDGALYMGGPWTGNENRMFLADESAAFTNEAVAHRISHVEQRWIDRVHSVAGGAQLHMRQDQLDAVPTLVIRYRIEPTGEFARDDGVFRMATNLVREYRIAWDVRVLGADGVEKWRERFRSTRREEIPLVRTLGMVSSRDVYAAILLSAVDGAFVGTNGEPLPTEYTL